MLQNTPGGAGSHAAFAAISSCLFRHSVTPTADTPPCRLIRLLLAARHGADIKAVRAMLPAAFCFRAEAYAECILAI